MRKRFLVLSLVTALCLSAVSVPPASAQTIRVFVDGQQVAFDQPPLAVGGRILVPLRGVFENLGATVRWDPATSTATAVRGDTQVRLTVGSRQAFVNDRVVALDVPALIVGGRTLVPLRFVSEAMGARVDWDDASRTALITSAAMAQPVPPPAAPPAPAQPAPASPAPAPPPSAAVVDGTVLRTDLQAAPQRILIDRDGRIYTFTVTGETTITVVEVVSTRTTAVTLEQVRTGSLVRVTADTAGQAILIRISVREIGGRIDAVTNRMIALAGGQTFTFADEARVLVDGRDVPREQLRSGMDVVLRLNPQTNLVLEVSARAVAQPAPAPQPSQPAIAIRIQSFAHGAAQPLRAGQTLGVTLQGSPGGTATFEIYGIATGLPMREASPGIYQGAYVVKAGDNATNSAVFGRLRVGTQDAPLVQAGTPVTIDTTPPIIVQRYPEAGTSVSNVRPNILVTFGDQSGSGVDPSAVRLFVNEQDVTAASTVTETAIAYSPSGPLGDRAAVRLVLADRAGNVTDDRFVFRVVLQQATLIRSVTAQPTTPLRAGDILTLTVTGESGGQAAFRIEGVTDWRPMAEATNQPGTYVGTYAIRPGDDAQAARVLVQMVRGGITSRSEATARLTIVAADMVAAPTITAPAPGGRGRAPLVIRGRATPGHRVIVRVDYKGSVLVFEVRGTLGEATTTVDSSGNWTVTFNQDAPVTGAEVTINATAVDALNRRSQPAVVVVRQG